MIPLETSLENSPRNSAENDDSTLTEEKDKIRKKSEEKAAFYIENSIIFTEEKLPKYKIKANEDIRKWTRKTVAEHVAGTFTNMQVPIDKNSIANMGCQVASRVTHILVSYQSKKKKQKEARKVINLFDPLKDEDIRQLLAEVFAEIYYSFQYQFNQLTDVNNSWKYGLKEVGKDTQRRITGYLKNQDNVESITLKTLTEAVILGRTKFFDGSTIKLKSGEKKKTKDIFGILGFKVMNDNFATTSSSSMVPQQSETDPCHSDSTPSVVPLERESPRITYYYKKTSKTKISKSPNDYRFPFDGEIKDNWEEEYTTVEDIEDEIADTVVLQRSSLKKIQSDVLAELAKNENQDAESKNREAENMTPLKGFRFNLFPPVSYYISREKELKKLHFLLQKNKQNFVIAQCATISGLVGSGKTQLARGYASKYGKTHYNGNIIVIDSETENFLKESFKNLAKDPELDIQIENEAAMLKAIWKRLYLSKCLIIFANAVKLEDIKKYFPPPPPYEGAIRPTTLITSHNKDWFAGDDGFIEVLILDVLTNNESLKYVKKTWKIPETDASSDKEIGVYTRSLCRFPLALRQCTPLLISDESKNKYNYEKVEIIKCKIDKFIYNFMQNPKEYLNHFEPEGNNHYTKSLYTTWRVYLEFIKKEENGKDAIELMEIIAYIDPEAIYEHDELEEDDKLVENKIKNKRRIGWDLLSKHCLITIKKGEYYGLDVSVLRLKQIFIRLWVKDENREETVLRKVLENIKGQRVHGLDFWNTASNYKPLIDDFALNNNYCILIIDLLNDKKHKAVDNIINRLEGLEGTPSNINWKKLLLYGGISDKKIKDGDPDKYEISAKNLCLFWSYLVKSIYFPFNLDKMTKFLDYFDKSMLSDILYSDRCYYWYEPLLCSIIGFNNLELIKWLLNKDTSLGEKMLHYAARFGRKNILELIAKNIKDWNCKDKFGRTPIYYATEYKHVEAVDFLLRKGADPTIPYDKEGNAWQLAAMRWNLDLLKVFKLDKEKCNSKDSCGRTLLHFAVFKGYRFEMIPIPVIEYLLDIGADPLICDNDGRNSIWYALRDGRTEVVKLFIERGFLDINSTKFKNGESPLHVAALSRNVELVRMLLELGADKTCADNNGVKLIHLACERQRGERELQLSFVKLCAHSDSDYDSPTKLGETPLHYAAADGCCTVTEFLLDKQNVDPHRPNADGVTPLEIALRNKHGCIVTVFAERGLIDVKEKLPNGQYPIQVALDNWDFEWVRSLIEGGADSTLAGSDGLRAVHLAAQKGDVDFLKRFDIQELESQTADKRTPLHFTVYPRRVGAIEFLLDKVDPYIVDEHGLPAFAHALDLETFTPFLNRVDLSKPFNAVGITPLVHTLLCGKGKHSKALLRKLLAKIEINMCVNNDTYNDTLLGKLQITALHVAAYVDNYYAVKFLTENCEMDVNSGLDVSWTPLQAARPGSAVSSFLSDRGAVIAKDNSAVVFGIIEDFWENEENRKLVDSYLRRFKYDIIKIEDIKKYTKKVHQLYLGSFLVYIQQLFPSTYMDL